MPFSFEGMQVRHINEKITTVFIPHSFQKQIFKIFQHSVPWLVEPVSNATHNCIQTFKIVLKKVFYWGTRVMTLKSATDNFGLTELVSFHMALRLVGYFTNLDSAILNLTVSICSKFEPCMVVLALLHLRVWLHETNFHEWRHTRCNF